MKFGSILDPILANSVIKHIPLKEIPVVVKRQAEEVEKRAPDKLRAQKNLKLKTRARLNKRARKQKRIKALESKLR